MYKVNDEDDSFNNLVLAGDENFKSLGTSMRIMRDLPFLSRSKRNSPLLQSAKSIKISLPELKFYWKSLIDKKGLL